MQRLEIDASGWVTALDFYQAILDALGAPEWHGRNINVLIDSVIYGDINAVEPPFRLEVAGISHSKSEALAELRDAFQALEEEGADYRVVDTDKVILEIEWPLSSNSRNVVH